MPITPEQFREITDCGPEGCGGCDVCRYLAFIEEAQSVAPGGSVIHRNAELEKYIAEKYEHHRERF